MQGFLKWAWEENLLCGKEDAIDKEIEQALFDAGAKEIVDGLKDGLETVYGTKGTYFSGGEAQRLVIARAFLKDAEYVILDEANRFCRSWKWTHYTGIFQKVSWK